MATREPNLPGQAPPLADALDNLGRMLMGDEPFDREAARREFERMRGLLGETYTSDNLSEANVSVTKEVIEAEDRLGSVEVLRRRRDVGNKLQAWAKAIREGARYNVDGNTR